MQKQKKATKKKTKKKANEQIFTPVYSWISVSQNRFDDPSL